MTTTLIDQPSTRRRPSPVVQPVRRRAAVRGPLARPERLTAPSRLGDIDVVRGAMGVVPPRSTTAARGCQVGAVSRRSTSWRLTDRGIALVLALAALLVVAAVTVIGLTAWRVTGPGYQSTGVSELSRR
jgi:hypothetical protein